MSSKFQTEAKTRLRLILNGYKFEENYRPDWLRNPQTGAKLEIDFWLPEPQIAIEVQGRQHYDFVPHFHKSIEAYQDQLDRDNIKRTICQERRIFFYEVFNMADIDRFIESVKAYSREMAAVLLRKHTAIKVLSYYAAHLYTETRKKEPGQEKLAKYSSKMVAIASQYGIPLRSIEPDFCITKVALSNDNKPTIRIRLIAHDDHTIKSEWGAIVKLHGSIATVQWRDKHNGVVSHLEMDFDLLTSFQIAPTDTFRWRVSPKTLRRPLNIPDEPMYESVAEIFRNRADIEWEEKDIKSPVNPEPFQYWRKKRLRKG